MAFFHRKLVVFFPWVVTSHTRHGILLSFIYWTGFALTMVWLPATSIRAPCLLSQWVINLNYFCNLVRIKSHYYLVMGFQLYFVVQSIVYCGPCVFLFLTSTTANKIGLFPFGAGYNLLFNWKPEELMLTYTPTKMHNELIKLCGQILRECIAVKANASMRFSVLADEAVTFFPFFLTDPLSKIMAYPKPVC